MKHVVARPAVDNEVNISGGFGDGGSAGRGVVVLVIVLEHSEARLSVVVHVVGNVAGAVVAPVVVVVVVAVVVVVRARVV